MKRCLAARMPSVLALVLLAACSALDDDVSLGDHAEPKDHGDAGAEVPQDVRLPTPPLSAGAPVILPHREGACDEPTECVAAPREPWITNDGAEFALRNFVLDDTYLYWTAWAPNQTGIWRAHRVSAEKERLLVTGDVHSLAVDATHLYFARGSTQELAGFEPVSGVWRVPKSGGAVEALVSGGLRSGQVTVDLTHVYYSAVGPGGIVGIQRIAKAGGDPAFLAPVEEASRFSVDGPDLVLSEGEGRIQHVPTTGGPATTLFDTVMAPELAVGGGFAYFMYVSEEDCGPCGPDVPFRLGRVPARGGRAEELHSIMLRPGTLATRSDAVIWGNWFLPHDGSTPSRLVPDEYWIIPVAADDSEIFLGSHYGFIYKIVQ